MVVERFPLGPDPVYARFREKGRMLPEGLHYIDSWLTADGMRCFQIMETDDPALFDVWTANWAGLAEFEIVELGAKPV